MPDALKMLAVYCGVALAAHLVTCAPAVVADVRLQRGHGAKSRGQPTSERLPKEPTPLEFNSLYPPRPMSIPTPKPLPAPDLTTIMFGPSQNTRLMDLDRPVTPWGPQPVDWGGRVSLYRDKVRVSEKAEIKGTCVSACTMFLGAKNVCVHHDAMVWFHSAFNPTTHTVSRAGNEEMSKHWPPQVRDWALKVGVFNTTDFTWRKVLTGVELIAMGVAPCKPPHERQVSERR